MRSPHAYLVDTGWLALKECLDGCDGRVVDGKSGSSPGNIPVACPGTSVGSVGAVVNSCGALGRRKRTNQRLCQ